MTYVSKHKQIQSCPGMASLLRGTVFDTKITRNTNIFTSIPTLPQCVKVVQLLSRQFIGGPIVALADAELVGLVHVFQRRVFETNIRLK